ncbi:MAG: DUF86 domain-containing protein [Oscillospiraceae bacterium]|jgi:uncharacterized protein with HEPN domain|nr:DUF86 domain-containing protein [Oscillospiraceae bacterium]
MKNERLNKKVARQMLREIDDIAAFLRGREEAEFLKSPLLQKAVVMSLLNIGELSKDFTDDFYERTPQIPWYDIRSTRNLAAHTYEAIDMRDVWETYRSDLPWLRKELSPYAG